VVRAATVAMQWCGKHASTIETVFSAWFVRKVILKTIGATVQLRVEGSVVEC
jgi:hypothetical protein